MQGWVRLLVNVLEIPETQFSAVVTMNTISTLDMSTVHTHDKMNNTTVYKEGHARASPDFPQKYSYPSLSGP